MQLDQQLADRRILKAALDVFADKGLRDTRVQDLLEAGGIARRTFYKYFQSKEDVLKKLYAFATEELVSQIVLAQRESDDPLAGLRAALDAYLEFHLTNHAIARLLIEEAIHSESPLHARRAVFRDELIAALSDATQQLTGRQMDRYVFVALISGLEGVSLELLAGSRTREDLARARATILGMVAAITQSHALLPVAQPG